MRPDGTDRKKRPLLAAFCIPAAIMLAAVAYRRIYPFGDRCFLRVDLYHQYMPFFMELRRKLTEGGSLAFTWNGGLGVNFLALYAYYLASPVNWLLALCPEDAVIEFMTALIVIKTGLCGLSFAWYLKRHFHADGYETAAFAVFYALSGYMAAYQWNIMWLDCIVLAPVILLGLEELLLRRRPLLYCVSLACSILTNYYISIFICIYLVLHTGLVLFSAGPAAAGENGIRALRRERGSGFGRFTGYSLLAGGLAGVVWVPGVLALRATRFHDIHFPQVVKVYFDLPEILARHCVNVGTELRNAHWPNIYCGAAVFFLLPLYFFSRGIPRRERCLKCLLLCFFYGSFSLNYMDFFWHGMNFPDSLPARQSFLYIFLVLTMCFEAFMHLREAAGGRIVLSAVSGLLLLYLCARPGRNGELSRSSFVFTALYLLTTVFLLVWFSVVGTGAGKTVSAVFLFWLVLAEVSMNLVTTGVPTVSRSGYRADYLANRALLRAVEGEREEEPGPLLTRIELHGRMTKNDGMLAGFPTATFFSSTGNADTAYFYRRLGMSTSKVFYSYEGATPLSSAMLSVAYTISASPEITDDFHELLAVWQGKYLYRNRCVLPPGFVVPPGLEDNRDMDAGNPVEVQNDLVRALGIERPLFQAVPVVWENGKVCVEAEENGYYYAYPLSCGTRDIAADRNGYETVYEKVYYPYILNLGWCSRGGGIVLAESGARRSEKPLDTAVYRLDSSVLEEALERLGEQPLEITASADGYVSGTVETKEDGVLVTSIPAEDGWRVSVDGKPAAVRPFGGAMLGVSLPAGRHTVVFAYRPPGLYAGAAVSIISVLCVIMLHVPFPRDPAVPARLRRRRDRGHRSERAAM